MEGLGRTEEALEVLDEVEQIAEDMDEVGGRNGLAMGSRGF